MSNEVTVTCPEFILAVQEFLRDIGLLYETPRSEWTPAGRCALIQYQTREGMSYTTRDLLPYHKDALLPELRAIFDMLNSTTVLADSDEDINTSTVEETVSDEDDLGDIGTGTLSLEVEESVIVDTDVEADELAQLEAELAALEEADAEDITVIS